MATVMSLRVQILSIKLLCPPVCWLCWATGCPVTNVCCCPRLCISIQRIVKRLNLIFLGSHFAEAAQLFWPFCVTRLNLGHMFILEPVAGKRNRNYWGIRVYSCIFVPGLCLCTSLSFTKKGQWTWLPFHLKARLIRYYLLKGQVVLSIFTPHFSFLTTDFPSTGCSAASFGRHLFFPLLPGGHPYR